MPAQKLPSRYDVMRKLHESAQRLSLIWDSAMQTNIQRSRPETWAVIKKLSDELEKLDPMLEDLSDGRILEVWATPIDPPERVDLEGICTDLAIIVRQTSCILSILQGKPPRLKARGSGVR